MAKSRGNSDVLRTLNEVEKQDKEFIKRLKDEINLIRDDCSLTIKGVKKLIELEIDKLAGEKLK